jgi:hypothetical protein
VIERADIYEPYPEPLHDVQVTFPLLVQLPHASHLDVSLAVTGCVHRPPCPPHDQQLVVPLPPHEPHRGLCCDGSHDGDWDVVGGGV